MANDPQIDAQMTEQSMPNRYRGLSVLVGFFLLLLVVLSGITFYASYQLEQSAQRLKLVAQQGMTVQRLSKDVLDINLLLDEARQNKPMLGNVVQIEQLPKHAWSRIDDTEKQKLFFESIIQALKNGGVVVAPNGERIEIAPVKDDGLLTEIHQIESVWQPYAKLLEKFHENASNKVIHQKSIQSLVEYIRPHDESLQIQINGLANGLYRLAQTQMTYLRYIQIGGVGFGLLLLLMAFFVLRRLSYDDVVLDAARHETYEIMRTIDTGLFLLDKDLVIGNQHSEALVDILGTDRLAGESLSSVLRNRISEGDLKTAEEFLEQLYRPHVKEKLVKSLNPLNKVRIQDPKRPGESRYLDFRFSRVYENKEISHILVNVSDVSEAVRLENRLKKERAENDMRIEMLTSILNTSPKVINEFIHNTYTHIDKMNTILRKSGSSQFELENKVMAIYREMHTLKGEASALRLHSFTKIATEAEDKLYGMQNQGKLSGNDFLPLTVHLDDLFRLANTIANLGERMSAVLDETDMTALQAVGNADGVALDTSENKKAGFVSLDQMAGQVEAETQLGDFLMSFAQDIAKRQGKLVEVDITQIQGKHIPDRLSAVVKEICIQLLRNAIVHGIADPQTRTQRGKTPTGRVKISLADYAGEQKDSLIFAVEDDGQGIDYAAIRDKLRQGNLYPPDKVEALSEAQLLNALFSSGFTTKSEADEDGGRGVGLDLVKVRVKEFGGKINVQSQAGLYSRFIIKLPML